jgi:hypothetical protein
MTGRYAFPFQPVHCSSALSAAFNSTNGSSGLYALESTGEREWQHPTSRAVRISGINSTADFYAAFGSSLIACGTTDGMLVLGGVAEVFHVDATQNYIVFKSSTDVGPFNVTLGYGF